MLDNFVIHWYQNNWLLNRLWNKNLIILSQKQYLSQLFCIQKCPNTELFLVLIFLCSDWTRTRNNSVSGHISGSATIKKCTEKQLFWKFQKKIKINGRVQFKSKYKFPVCIIPPLISSNDFVKLTLLIFEHL